jgi:hypothetical protein
MVLICSMYLLVPLRNKHSQAYAIQSYATSELHNLSTKTLKQLFFYNRVQFFLAGVKALRDAGGRRILLGNNKGCWAVTLRPMRSHYVGV